MFEFDEAKSRANKAKHGIDFVRAQALWDDPDLLLIPTRVEGEPRQIAIGLLAGKCWSAVITQRDNSIHIISVRRSRKEEKELYENQDL